MYVSRTNINNAVAHAVSVEYRSDDIIAAAEARENFCSWDKGA